MSPCNDNDKSVMFMSGAGGCCNDGKGAISCQRSTPGKGQRTRGGQANANAREASRANVHRNPVCSAFVREIGYQRKKALGMAASDDRMPPGHQFVIFKQCDGAGFGRRVDYQSPQSYSPG